jgi:lactoylglutathione lyase
MKRFHVHVHVADLAQSVAFYAKMFAAEPTRRESDYAKWMLDDPRINFAISTFGSTVGVDHLGVQTDDAAELAELKERAAAAELAVFDQGTTSCCYARSEKHWITDPQGVAWEHFHTLGDIPVFHRPEPGDASAAVRNADEAGCCASTTSRGKSGAVQVRAGGSCC